jgi:flagellar basal body-associated protein FliL
MSAASDKKEEKKSEADAASADAAPKKKSPIKLVAIVGAIMVIEAVGVFLVVGATGKKPADAHAAEIKGAEHADEEQTVEIPLVEDKFQSMQGAQIWIWDVNVVLKAKKKNEEFITKALEARAAEIHEAVSMIFRRAQLLQLREPGLETINRQISAYMNKLLGKDPEGKDRFERVVIPKCKGFAAN